MAHATVRFSRWSGPTTIGFSGHQSPSPIPGVDQSVNDFLVGQLEYRAWGAGTVLTFITILEAAIT